MGWKINSGDSVWKTVMMLCFVLSDKIKSSNNWELLCFIQAACYSFLTRAHWEKSLIGHLT